MEWHSAETPMFPVSGAAPKTATTGAAPVVGGWSCWGALLTEDYRSKTPTLVTA